MQDELTQSAGAQGALGLLCSGGRAYTAWAGLVSFLFSFFADALLKKKMWVGSIVKYRENTTCHRGKPISSSR